MVYPFSVRDSTLASKILFLSFFFGLIRVKHINLNVLMCSNSYSPLNQSLELSSYLEDMYVSAAQYNMPPEYPVNMICNAIDQASHGHNIIDRIYSGVVAFYGNHTCHIHHSTSKKDDGWGWQVYI
jgi:lysosomal Pro-X carboxypeptidase